MQFCGYYNRVSILRLKDKSEVSKMFKFVIDRQELVEDKKPMFGIFATNPSLLTVLPGLKPILKRFIGKVEDLVPKKQSSTTRSSEKMSSKKVHSSSSSSSSVSKATIPTAEDLGGRYIKWAKKQVENLNKDIDPEELRKSFKIQSTTNNSFVFICLQAKCHEKLMLHFVDRTSSVNMSNIHRHITPKFTTSVTTSISFSKAKICTKVTPENNNNLTPID